MIHGVIIRLDNKRIERDYPTMDEYLEEVNRQRDTAGLKFMSADTVKAREIRQGRMRYDG